MLHPGKEDTFWEAQIRWNSGQTFQPILQNNLFYMICSTMSGTEVIHFYCYENFKRWQETYKLYFNEQDPEFFVTVRGAMVSQQVDFFVESPISSLMDYRKSGEVVSDIHVVETMSYLMPGQLSSYWHEDVQSQPSLAIQSLTGLLHRALEYRHFPSKQAAEDYVSNVEVSGSPNTVSKRQIKIGSAPELTGRFSFFNANMAAV